MKAQEARGISKNNQSLNHGEFLIEILTNIKYAANNGLLSVSIDLSSEDKRRLSAIVFLELKQLGYSVHLDCGTVLQPVKIVVSWD